MRKFVDVYMDSILLAVFALLALVIWAGMVSAGESRAFWDRNDHFSGSTQTYNQGRNTSAYDRDGHFAGSAIRNSDGTTSFYDRSGRFTGSSTNAAQPK
jgi:hypothetical protein